MKLPQNSIISSEKIIGYLLKPNKTNDKSKFLALGGYSLDNWLDLEHDLRALLRHPADLGQRNKYGQFFEIKGNLRNLKVKTIWLWEHGAEAPRFITLVPVQ